MYARTTTIEARPSSIDEGISHVRGTVMPALEGLDGYVGLSMVADRSSGRCITTSAWESEEAMRASASAAAAVRSRAAEIFGGTPTVEEWEIAVLHRDRDAGEGACVRVTWANVDPGQIAPGIEGFKAAMSAMRDFEGFCSASLLVNKASGRGVSSMAFESADAMELNRAEMERLRNSVSDEVSAQILEERDFELMIAHLRVPEMA